LPSNSAIGIPGMDVSSLVVEPVSSSGALCWLQVGENIL
jgi:hypothetical protein